MHTFEPTAENPHRADVLAARKEVKELIDGLARLVADHGSQWRASSIAGLADTLVIASERLHSVECAALRWHHSM